MLIFVLDIYVLFFAGIVVLIFSIVMCWNLGIRDMWEKSMNGLLSLVKKSTPSSFTYICEKSGSSLTHKV